MESSLDPALIGDFGVALLIGALLGLERETRKRIEAESGIGGIRTFILFAQAGAVSAWISVQQHNPWPFVAAVLAVAGLVAVGYHASTRLHPESLGLTTEIAAVATCLLGGMVLFGYREVAIALAIVTSAVLAYKRPLHRLVELIGTDDLYAAVKLLIASFVVLPLLPNQTVDPWSALNPYALWLLVILISSLSLVGYVAVRWLGPARGTVMTGLFGGLVSSTAVTLSFARRSREAGADEASADALAAGILLAWTVMFARVLVLVAIVFLPLLPSLLPSYAAMGAVALIATGIFYRRSAVRGSPDAGGAEVALRNPFSLSAAVRFAALFAAVLLLVKIAQARVAARGLYLIAALAGLTDVDAITLSVAGLARGGLASSTAAGAVVAAALANTFVKTGLVSALGTPALRRRVLTGTAAVALAGVTALLVTR